MTTSPRGTSRSASIAARWNGVHHSRSSGDVVEVDGSPASSPWTRRTHPARSRHRLVRLRRLRFAKGTRGSPWGRAPAVEPSAAKECSTTRAVRRPSSPSPSPRPRSACRLTPTSPTLLSGRMSAPGIFRPPPPTTSRSGATRRARPSGPSCRTGCATMSNERIRDPARDRRRGRRDRRDVRGGHAAPQARTCSRTSAREAPPRSSARSRRPRDAWHDWSRTPWEERAAVLLRAAELLAGPWRSDAERRDDARPVEDRAPGRDRRGVRGDRLLPLQRRVHGADLRGAADLLAGRLEPAWSTGRSRASSSP